MKSSVSSVFSVVPDHARLSDVGTGDQIASPTSAPDAHARVDDVGTGGPSTLQAAPHRGDVLNH